MKISGIKFETDTKGLPKFVRIDLKKYGNNELLEDFLDSIEIEKRKDEDEIPWEEVKKKLNKTHGIK